MKHLLAYKQQKDTIDGLLTDASNSFYSLVEAFQECDDTFMMLVNEKSELDKTKELSISASEMYDAYELVENTMLNTITLIAKIGMNEKNGLAAYTNISEYINPTKEIIPDIKILIQTVSSQMSDFIELVKTYQYNEIKDVSVKNIRKYMKMNDLVTRISRTIYKTTIDEHEIINSYIKTLKKDLDTKNTIYESIEDVKAQCFVTMIPDTAIIAVGDTEKEAWNKTKDYFNDEISDEVVIKKCSQGLYNIVTMNDTYPEEWEELDGVIVLPEEYENYLRATDNNEDVI